MWVKFKSNLKCYSCPRDHRLPRVVYLPANEPLASIEMNDNVTLIFFFFLSTVRVLKVKPISEEFQSDRACTTIYHYSEHDGTRGRKKKPKSLPLLLVANVEPASLARDTFLCNLTAALDVHCIHSDSVIASRTSTSVDRYKSVPMKKRTTVVFECKNKKKQKKTVCY